MPNVYLAKDALATTQGGGFLSKFYEVMGCWLNLMRGVTAAAQFMNDADKMPFNALPAEKFSFEIQAEGFSYDFDIVRRPLTSLIFV
jgi:hypothetical protein